MNIRDEETRSVLINAVRAGMAVVRNNQGGHLPDDADIKDDKTLVTAIDHCSEAKITEVIHANLGDDVRIVREEGGVIGSGKLALLTDALDGTRVFVNGLATSTVILGMYDTEEKTVVGCVIGEAVSDRIWSAFGEEPTVLRRFSEKPVSVWPGSLNDQSTVFLDISHGFTRKGRQILTDAQMARLFATLNSRVKIQIPGSNGLIQALVANGGQKVVGSITTAIGGPWDVCGVKLVLNADGAARAFSVFRRGSIIEDHFLLEEKDPLDVMSYDLLICGNNKETVDFLSLSLSVAGLQ